MKSKIFFFLVFPLFCYSCVGNKTENTHENKVYSVWNLHYAKGFRVTYTPSYKKVELLHNQNRTVIGRYYLVRQEQTVVPDDGQKLVIPLRKIAVTSNTHLEFLSVIGELDAIAGVCSPHLIYNDSVVSKYNAGKT